MLLPPKTLEWIGETIHTPVQHIVTTLLKGSNSSPILLIQNRRNKKFVLRALTDRKWLADEPDLARHEAAALMEAKKAGLAVPEIIAFTENAGTTDFPVVLSTFLEGKIQLHPANFQHWLEELAFKLAELHRHRAPDFAWQYHSWTDPQSLRTPQWSKHPDIWESAFRLASGCPPSFHPVFIHRDYHPTNVLWTNNIISGIVDWIHACQGPAGVDVAHCRNNLALLFDVAAAEQFLEMYIQASDDFEYHPYWDIDSILNMCLPAPEFYQPWQEFGMKIIAPAALQHRTEDYLQSVLKRI